MKKNDINIAIALHMGTYHLGKDLGYSHQAEFWYVESAIGTNRAINGDFDGLRFDYVSLNFTASLDAMREVEETLDDSYEATPPRQCVEYAKLLQSVGATTDGGKSEFGVAHSSAADRAEAFLRVFGKWEEGE